MRKMFALALLVITMRASATTITIADYVAELEHIDTLLAAEQLPAAQAEAKALLDTDVQWSKGTFAADASLLHAVLDAQRPQGAHRAQLLATIAELRRAAGMESATTDRKLLQRIASEQEAPELPKGGDVKTTTDADMPMLERIASAIADMVQWLRDLMRRFIDWLLDFLPGARPTGSAATPGLRWIVTVVVIVIVLLLIILAIDVIRRSRAATPAAQSSAPIGSKLDEDPLSRGASEWERYAGELANAGRYREAIRAWYHAVLVTCYAAGILHFRKGRTNWEYVASLAPSLAWRPDVIELTRRFEQEWYGGDESDEDALATCRTRAQRVLDSVRAEMRGAA
jgi:hypothetical protein